MSLVVPSPVGVLVVVVRRRVMVACMCFPKVWSPFFSFNGVERDRRAHVGMLLYVRFRGSSHSLLDPSQLAIVARKYVIAMVHVCIVY